jgi:Ser/Thr protein kinase RdoA (MazF antagonist)
MSHKRLYFIPVEKDRVAERLSALFGIENMTDFSPVEGGYMCRNFRIDTDQGVYFLKQYRNQISSIVHEIKASEVYFAQQGLPVIEPVYDRFDRPVFWLDGHWMSLFPFIDGKSPSYQQITKKTAFALGNMLGRIHKAGTVAKHEQIQTLRLGDRKKFMIESIELSYDLKERANRTELEERILDILSQKKEWIRNNQLPPRDIALSFDCMLHGDFIYPNVFMDTEERITHLYDFEKTCRGPRAYEFARSLFINCFDDGWSEENLVLAKQFLEAYQCVQPLSKVDMVKGIRMYAQDVMHMTWVEAKYVIYDIDVQMALYERLAKRVEWISKDLDEFCYQMTQI